jgi:hypothetical protein
MKKLWDKGRPDGRKFRDSSFEEFVESWYVGKPSKYWQSKKIDLENK